MGEKATRRTAVIIAVFVLVLSMAVPVVLGIGGVTSASYRSTGGLASASSAGTTTTAVSAGTAATLRATPSGPAVATSPHPGTLDIYEVSPAGADSVDPAVAYDTVSYEPILNVYQTLINYNGVSTNTFVPTLATCVPGTAQCVTDYGSNLTGYVGGQPMYWTFVIDKNARFFDPSTSATWSVYPSDVMFSLARTMAFTDIPYAGKTPGWILSQSLLPFGNPGWDGGAHFPFNNTPSNILSSMLVNDSAYCPAAAMSSENGCITFHANGGGSAWPIFLELIADNLGGSVVPCGWFSASAQNASIPGWAGTAAANGDGSCALPDGGTTTNATAWSTYLSGLSPTAWDSYEALDAAWPATNPHVQFAAVGSGPYGAAVTAGTGYQLEVNPGYAQPSGCSGSGGVATYSGYCDPAAGGYIGNVNVFWEPDDSFGISQYTSGQADLAGIEAVHTSTMVSLESSGKLNIYQFPTISSFFTPINLAFNAGNYATDFPTQPTQNIPSTFFSNIALRNFYVDSYPYKVVNQTVNTVDNISYDFNAAGPIPFGMGSYYPSNVSFPYKLGGGVPDSNPSDIGGAAWWLAQAKNPTSPFYSAALASCTVGTPCTWAIAGLSGDPSGDIAIADWIASIETLSGNTLKPFGGSSFDLTFPQFLNTAFASPFTGPLVSETGTGWAPDYPDPTDYMTPMALPDQTYTAPETFNEIVSNNSYGTNSPSCGHTGFAGMADFHNLTYWAAAAASYSLPNDCQGAAYGVSVAASTYAGGLPPTSATRVLLYNEIEFILNGLAMFTYNGQQNAVLTAAPWIYGPSLNTNVMIGGGGDQIWFHLQYLPFESSVTFKELGLPLGAHWGVSAGSPPQTFSNTTYSRGGSITVQEANGSVAFSANSPAGYGLALVTGPNHPTYSSVAATGRAVTYVLHFGTLESVNFNETVINHWPGLPAGDSWTVTLTAVNPGGMPGSSNSTTGSTIGFILPKGSHFKFVISATTATHSALTTYIIAPPHGGLGVGLHPLTKIVKFRPMTSPVHFVVHGLPRGATFDVNVVGALNNNAPYASTWMNGTRTAEVFFLTTGSYNYTVATNAPGTLTPVSGTISTTAPHALVVVVTYAAQHGAIVGLPVVSPMTAQLHNNLIATPSGGREAV